MKREQKETDLQMIPESRRVTKLRKSIRERSYTIGAEEIAGKMLQKCLFKPALSQYLAIYKAPRVNGVKACFGVRSSTWN